MVFVHNLPVADWGGSQFWNMISNVEIASSLSSNADTAIGQFRKDMLQKKVVACLAGTSGAESKLLLTNRCVQFANCQEVLEGAGS